MNEEQIPPPPEGGRILNVGEFTRPGDFGFMVWDGGRKRAWVELRAVHVIYQPIIRQGMVWRNVSVEKQP